MVELLTVIAIIAVLAAIIFPVFAAAREQARQSSTMSHLQAVYTGVRLFYEDEGRFPPSLFGYAVVPIPPGDPNNLSEEPMFRPALPSDSPNDVMPMDQARHKFVTYLGGANVYQGYLYREQLKDVETFLCPVNPVKDKRAVTRVYYPRSVWPLIDPASPNTLDDNKLVRWMQSSAGPPRTVGDSDLPLHPGDVNTPNNRYVGAEKIFYTMDSMDIGPMIDDDGNVMKDAAGNTVYELHYTPDWTHRIGSAEDTDPFPGPGAPVVTQLKYKNPPSDRTIITYVTDHVAYSGSSNIPMLLLSGTVRKANIRNLQQLPLQYR